MMLSQSRVLEVILHQQHIQWLPSVVGGTLVLIPVRAKT